MAIERETSAANTSMRAVTLRGKKGAPKNVRRDSRNLSE
jgi:hypothetical protein